MRNEKPKRKRATMSEQSPDTPASNNQLILVLVGVIAIGMLGVGAVIWLSNNTAQSPITPVDYDTISASRLSDGGFVLGDADAPITIVEFADFLCPHCQDYQTTVDRFIRDFVVTGQARFEYRFTPISESSFTVAGFVECAEIVQPGTFWQAHDLMFTITSSRALNQQALNDFATALEIPYTDLANCVPNARQIETDMALGDTVAVSGTPALRMRGSDGVLTMIVYNGRTYDRGAVPYDVLAGVVRQAQGQ
jgi:protein-disulfide isomerase